LDVFRKRGWKETEVEKDAEWDILWADREWIYDILNHYHLQPYQKINHFRNHYELTRKDLMVKNLKRFKKTLTKEGKTEEEQGLDFFPTTHNLPADYSLFVEEFKKNPGSVWIMKPIARAQGKGNLTPYNISYRYFLVHKARPNLTMEERFQVETRFSSSRSIHRAEVHPQTVFNWRQKI